MAEDRKEQPPAGENERDPQREESGNRTRRAHRAGSESQRSALERLAADLLKKGFEAGRDTLRQTDERLKNVGESVFTREMAHYFASQMGDIRNAITKSIAGEIGRFLREADLAAEIRRALSGMKVEANLRLTFPADEEAEADTRAKKESEPEEG